MYQVVQEKFDFWQQKSVFCEVKCKAFFTIYAVANG